MPKKPRTKRRKVILKKKNGKKENLDAPTLVAPDCAASSIPISQVLSSSNIDLSSTSVENLPVNYEPIPNNNEEKEDAFSSCFPQGDIPFDLSMKTSQSQDDLEKKNEETQENTSEIGIDPDDAGQITDEEFTPNPQEILIAHLSKIRQNFVSHFLQYQASFLTHYQKIQEQMLTKSDDKSSLPNLNYNGKDSEHNETEKIDEDEEEKVDEEGNSKEGSTPSANSSHTLLNLLAAQNMYGNVGSLPIVPSFFSSLSPYTINNPYIAALSLNSSLPFSTDYKDDDEDRVPGDEDSSSLQHVPLPIELLSKCSDSGDFPSQKYSSSSRNKEVSNNIDSDNEDADLGTANGFQFKRKRIAFSAQQYELLQTTFEHNNFPEPADQQCIARQLKAPYRSIKMWFQNKRANARKKLLPGEKGSGRGVNGEKIPGDTDTRFYCDQCPAAFICQKYLNNHFDAHTSFTTMCHKCNVIFTHEYLLRTHTLSKCGKNKSKDVPETKLEHSQENSCKKIKIEVADNHGSSLAINSHLKTENDDGNTTALLPHFSSTLPLLTLLQIQSKQEQKDINMEIGEDTQDSDSETNCKSENNDVGKEESLHEGEAALDTKVSVPLNKSSLRNIPPLIPSVLIPPCSDVSRLAILRHLLTNFQHKQSPNGNHGAKLNNTSIEDHDAVDHASSHSDYSTEEHDQAEPEPTSVAFDQKPPQNIPLHLYQLFQNKDTIGYSKSESDVDEQHDFSNEAMSPSHGEVDPGLQEEGRAAEKRKLEESSANPKENGGEKVKGPKQKRLRRRTTVFTEAQHRILYLHFTHCNFPDPCMFRILSKLTNLTPHVIKIWFQNERSRQRRQVTSDSEAPREKKPYKCRDCGVEFAMPAFLVKHCLRHIPTDNVTSQAKKCPICMIEFDSQKLHSHFMASHNLSVNVDEEGGTEENICHLCEQHFNDLNSLSEHKYEHLKETQYGDPPQCVTCKTTFVNVLCLESHMATHNKFKWDHKCHKCQMAFYDKILLESHLISHNMNDRFPQGTQPHSQYLCSLIQQIADSNLKTIKVKQEVNSSSENIPTLSNFNSSPIKSEPDLMQGCSGAEKSISSKAPGINNLKFVPVQFVPVSTAITTSNSTPSTVLTCSNLSFVTSTPEKKVVISKRPQPPTSHKTSRNLENKLTCEQNDRIKQLPNLIPISEAANNKISKLNMSAIIETSISEKENSYELEIKEEVDYESDTNSKIDESDDSSHFLIYTPYASEYRKRRRTPTHFNAAQRDILEAYYKYDNFPDPNEQLRLSEYLQVPYSVIKTWFQNTRKNHRKHLKESYKFEEGGPFECWDCRVCFVSKIYLDSHIRQHQETQPFKCTMCSQQFPHQAVYDIHQKIGCSKKMKKRYDCLKQNSLSGQSVDSVTKSSLKSFNSDKVTQNQNQGFTTTHFKCKLGETNSLNLKLIKMESSYCNSEVNSSSPAFISNSNEEQKSNGTIDKEFKCSMCKENFTSMESFVNHENSCVSATAKNVELFPHKIIGYTCPDCNENFSSFLSIAEHKENSNCKALNDGINNVSDNNNIKCSDEHAVKMENGNAVLQLHYEHNNFPSTVELNLIAKRLKMEREKVASWFQNKRGRERRGKSIGYRAPQECSLCNAVFVHKVALTEHEQSVHNSTAIMIKFICPGESCQMMFPNSTLLETHQLSHSDKEALTDDGFSELKDHIKFLEIHYNENNFPSPMDVGFIARRLLIGSLSIHLWFKERRLRHMSELDKGVPKSSSSEPEEDSSYMKLSALECRICDVAFLDLAMLQEHEKLHVSNSSLICYECSLEFGNPLALETHLLHHGISSSKDVLSWSKTMKLGSLSELRCNYYQLKVLYSHFKQCNLPRKDEIKLISKRLHLPAKKINSWFKSQQHSKSLKFPKSKPNTHVTKKKATDLIPTCVTCSAEFNCTQNLEYHSKIHELGYTFLCQECGKVFYHETLLDTHALCHSRNLKVAAKALEIKVTENMKKLLCTSKEPKVGNNEQIMNDLSANDEEKDSEEIEDKEVEEEVDDYDEDEAKLIIDENSEVARK